MAGIACRPYPAFRLPGWERLSAELHLDDMHKFFEDPDGGRPYSSSLRPGMKLRRGDVIGLGYEFATASVFFTFNGERLQDAFRGVFLPRESYDIYASIGVVGKNEFTVNFGADPARNPLKWKPGREWAWSLDGCLGSSGPSGSRVVGEYGADNSLPSYQDIINS